MWISSGLNLTCNIVLIYNQITKIGKFRTFCCPSPSLVQDPLASRTIRKRNQVGKLVTQFLCSRCNHNDTNYHIFHILS